MDRLVAGGFLRPGTALKSLRNGRVRWNRLPVAINLVLPGVLLEPLAWLQQLLLAHRCRSLRLPDNPVVIVGHWRSGTTFLHQLLAADPGVATARNSLTVAPQVAVLLKPVLIPLLQRLMTRTRPIDAVPWSAQDPQEDEIGLVRLTPDTNMAGVAFPWHYLHHFRRCVLSSTPDFERKLVHFTRLTWLHDGTDKHTLLIKNPAHTARVALLLRLFPRARFVFLKREPIDTIRSLVQVKQSLGNLVGLQAPLDDLTQVEETAEAYRCLLNAFDAARPLIPPGQLLEVPYDALVTDPFTTVQWIYSELNLPGWDQARDPIARRVAAASDYRARPVTLAPLAEERLQVLTLSLDGGDVTGQTPPDRRH